MKTYKYKNATIRVRGDIDKDRLRNAAVQFIKKSYRYKKMKERG